MSDRYREVYAKYQASIAAREYLGSSTDSEDDEEVSFTKLIANMDEAIDERASHGNKELLYELYENITYKYRDEVVAYYRALGFSVYGARQLELYQVFIKWDHELPKQPVDSDNLSWEHVDLYGSESDTDSDRHGKPRRYYVLDDDGDSDTASA